jgi:single-stranded-DNA-specific exonuclease
MITKWNFQTPTEEELHKRDRLASQLGLSPVVCLLLVQRGLTTVEEVKKFFKPSLNDLHDARYGEGGQTLE